MRMKKVKQLSEDAIKMVDFLKECKTYYLATVEKKQPRVRPFGTINIFENRIYIQTGKIKPTAKQIAINPRVEISCFNGEKWLRLTAELVADERVEAKKSMLDNYPELRKMYDENDNNTIVYFLRNPRAYYGAFVAPFKTEIKF